MMAEAGIGGGIGIDPGVHLERIDPRWDGTLTWVAERSTTVRADRRRRRGVPAHPGAHRPRRGIRPAGAASIGDRLDTAVLFELPDTTRVLDEVAFWDVYYEHCSYFTAGSLARLFAVNGFVGGGRPLRLRRPVPDARGPAGRRGRRRVVEGRRGGDGRRGGPVRHRVRHHHPGVDRPGAGRRRCRREYGRLGRRVEGGRLPAAVGAPIAAAVDINPHKQGKYMAGTGHRVIAPAELVALDPASWWR